MMISQQMRLLTLLTREWLTEHDPDCIQRYGVRKIDKNIKELIDVIGTLLSYMTVTQTAHDLLVPIFIYANKFVHYFGVKYNQLSNILITSMVLTVKFWDDDCTRTNAEIARGCGLPLSTLNRMEQIFLAHLDHNLFLTPSEISLFIANCRHLDHKHKKIPRSVQRNDTFVLRMKKHFLKLVLRK
eukprot:TRINITY_DN2756_c0_g1_i1.p1 TRINITY_DN2756_c0_g1~~TRINITY_DN2756_c0_g1_i1.p1  ORF type:complete len:185 (-),score=13.18 TRINITY_DN2756_c0_g1_i1:112-666(-)